MKYNHFISYLKFHTFSVCFKYRNSSGFQEQLVYFTIKYHKCKWKRYKSRINTEISPFLYFSCLASRPRTKKKKYIKTMHTNFIEKLPSVHFLLPGKKIISKSRSDFWFYHIYPLGTIYHLLPKQTIGIHLFFS